MDSGYLRDSDGELAAVGSKALRESGEDINEDALIYQDMEGTTVLAQVGQLGSPPALLIGLLALLVVFLVARVLLALAWHLVSVPHKVRY